METMETKKFLEEIKKNGEFFLEKIKEVVGLKEVEAMTCYYYYQEAQKKTFHAFMECIKKMEEE